ncbi:unnamed protein product [Peniophora sp. CBMAI 1063]|nr:unnamed protein product [Peniophora sp. CBMAI 1063]
MRLSLKFAALAQSLYALAAMATPNPLPGSSDIIVRDPAIWYNKHDWKYYVFSTGNNLTTFTSSKLTGPWTNEGPVFPNCSIINLNPDGCTLWAPDVNYIDGQYVLYYISSSLGSQNSTTGVATSPSMKPGTWTEHGAVLTSKEGDAFNAIDPNIINADGLKLTFGSYWQGIFQIDMHNITANASAPPGAHLAGANSRPAEGGFVYRPRLSPWYYFFYSYGKTPQVGQTSRPAEGAEYRVLVGRGKSAQGPFYDGEGRELTRDVDPPPGTLVLGSHDNVYAPGGQYIIHDPRTERDVIVYHYVKYDDPIGGPSYLGINYLDFSSGWPVVAH